jgi:hypothetical protein
MEELDYDKLGKVVAFHLYAQGHVCNLDESQIRSVDSVTWAKKHAQATDEDIANSFRLGQSLTKSAARNINSGGKIMFYLVGGIVSLLAVVGLGKAAIMFLSWWITK